MMRAECGSTWVWARQGTRYEAEMGSGMWWLHTVVCPSGMRKQGVSRGVREEYE